MNPDNDVPLYSISTAAKILGISVHTLRMYEREGLIIPFRKESLQRLYTRSDVERLNCIRKAINNEKLSIAGIISLYSMIPCWNIKKCSQTEKQECEAYKGHQKACWMFVHNNNICAKQNCRECTVYKDFSDCGKIKDSIKNISSVK
jgi:MerR family transcriptional regulator, heat shock protein HspR